MVSSAVGSLLGKRDIVEGRKVRINLGNGVKTHKIEIEPEEYSFLLTFIHLLVNT